MSELRKLFQTKRILAMALAVVMTVTSLPATAYAAVPDENQTVTEANAEDASAQSNTDTGGEETQEPSAETPADTTDDVQTEGEVTDQTPSEDTDLPQISVEPAEPQAEDVTTDADAQPSAAEAAETEFRELEQLGDNYKADGTSPVADGTGKKLSTAFLSNYNVKINGEYKDLSYLDDPVIATVTYQWFAGDSALGDPKKLSEEGTLPTDAGSYTVKFVLPAKENEYKGAEASYGYEISKVEVTAVIEEPAAVPVGMKCSEVSIPTVNSVSADNGKSFIYVVDDKSTEANEAANNEVAFTMVIKDAATGAALTGEQTLMKNSEYVVSIVPEFIGANKDKYEKNYTWKSLGEQKLPIGDLKATRLTLTPDASYAAKPAVVANDDDERTVQIVEAASWTKELQELKYTAVLEAEDGKDEQNQPKWKALDGQTAGEWYTAASYSEPWTEGDQTYCSLTLGGKLDAVPMIPGTYVYRVSYEGDRKEYSASYADIVVIVEVAEIIVRPTVPDKVTFYEGQTAKDVLSQITYDLPYADGRTENGKEVLYTQTPNMWGTSYVSGSVTQPYKPDFELVEIVKDKDGKEINRNTYNSSKNNTLKLGNDYIVRFTGEKNVYYDSGNPTQRTDINAAVDSMDPATCGFKVKTDQSTLEAEANTCKLTVAAKNKAIDVTEIEKAAADKAKMSLENVGALEGAFTKTYDGARIFELHADYKKAKLVSGASDPNNDFTYRWQMSEYSYAQLQGTHQEDGKDVPNVSKDDLENGRWSLQSFTSPVNAGIYRLHITYDNSRVNGFADPADVYFVIKPQAITLTFNKESLVGNVGNNATEFLMNHKQELNEGTGITPSMDQPTKAEDWKNAELLKEEADYAYSVSWLFYQKEKETNAEGQQVDKLGPDGKPVWNKYWGTLLEGGEYFLGVSGFGMGRYDGVLQDRDVFERNFDVKKDIYIPITVKAKGTDTIVFDGITTTGGKKIEKTKTYDAESLYTLIKDDLARLNAPVVIKKDAAGAETKEAVTFAEGEYGLTYTIWNSSTGESETYTTLPTEEAAWDWTKNAGTYSIRVKFGGNERYYDLPDTELAVITVKQKELVFVVPELTEEFTAGQPVSYVLDAAWDAFFGQDVASVKAVEGEIPEADRKYFIRTEIRGEAVFPAWYWDDGDYSTFSMPEVYVRDNVSGAEYGQDDAYALLQGTGDARYSLIGDYAAQGEDNLTGDNYISNNYTIIAAEPAKGTPIKVVRGASTVEMDERSGKKVDIKDYISIPEDNAGSIVKEHTVMIMDGIAYYNASPDDNDEKEGNIVNIRIKVPAEYDFYASSFDWNKVIYEQSIKNAAGDRLIGSIITDYSEQTLEFTYDATVRDKEKQEDLIFSIRWEEDYNERFIFKFSEAELLGNLKDAVAPKSLAFNAAPKTMVVGQEQELDVKIVKVQNADIICLGYEVTAGKEYMHVDEFGKVTALKEGGKATVEVFPMHLVDGKKVRIDGAKSAKTTITVKKVSAPKITKVTPTDHSIIVEYMPPAKNDGFRREIYVVEGKNVKADVIEKKVTDEMKNEQWQGIFAAPPSFINSAYESSGSISVSIDNYKKANAKAAVVEIDGLEPQKDYTVYVRNVSAVRSFADGCQVSLSAAGTAKSCKTTLKHVDDITALLDGEQIADIYDADGDHVYDKEYVDDTPTEEQIREASTIGYEIPLSKRNAQISLEGLFKDVAEDKIYVPIPFLKAEAAALKKSYAEPKITYYFQDYIYDGYDAYTGKEKIEKIGYTKSSSIAAVDKNGKITLKQPGTVTICAIDTASGVKANMIQIRVTAQADSMKAKNTSMQVGQRIRLENLVEYKEGKTVLNQDNYNTHGRIDVKEAQASLKSAGKESSFGISDSGYLTAYAKGSLNLTLKDKVLNTSVTVKISAKDLAPVKSLKAVNVIDNRFDVQFEMNQFAEAYRIEILDARRTVRSIYVENIPFSGDGGTYVSDDGHAWSRYDGWQDDDWGNGDWLDRRDSEADWKHDSEHFVKNDGLGRADKINGKWILTYRIKSLTQTSKYNIQVTALFGEVKSKVVKKAVTTTKLPACDSVLSGKIEPGKSYNDGLSLSKTGFVSGNTYSISITNGKNVKLNTMAQIAGTDTLTWSSSNKKVATVKAAPGGYSATLKALKDGETVIEVKSKVLKGVVARVSVRVFTVGDAYNSRDYYGDNESLRGESNGKPEVVTELTVGVAEPVELRTGQKKSFQVTLTEEGKYTAYKVEKGDKESWTSYTKYGNKPYTWNIKLDGSDGPFTGSVIVEKTGNVNASDIKNRTVLKLNETLSRTQRGAWYVFTAPNDGLYGFKQAGSSNVNIFSVYKQSTDKEAAPNTTTAESQKYFYELKKGDLVYLKANREYSSVQIVEAKFDALAVGSSVTIPRGDEKWFVFTPAEMDQYEFRKSNYSNDGIEFFDENFVNKNLSSTPDYQTSERVYYSILSSKLYIRIRNQSDSTATLRVDKKNAVQKFGEDGSYTISEHTFSSNNTNDYMYINYTTPADGFYTFSYEAAESDISGYAYLYKADNMNTSIGNMYVHTNGTYKISDRYLSRDTEVCLQISANNTPVTWKNVKFTVTKTGEAPVELQAGGEAVQGGTSGNKAVWYSFTAPEEGRYTVVFPKMEAAAGSIESTIYRDITGNRYSSRIINLSQGGFNATIALNAGDQRFIKVNPSNSSGADEIPFRIKIEKTSTDKAVTTAAPADLTEVENWVSFTAEADGCYSFSVTREAGNINSYLYVYKNLYDTSYDTYGSQPKLILSQGETIWLKATASSLLSDITKPDKLTARKSGEVQIANVKSDSSVTLSDLATAEDNGSCYTFVKVISDTDGSYKFSCSNSGITSMVLYTSFNMSDYGSTVYPVSGTCSTECDMTAGEAVYLKLVSSQVVTGITLTVESSSTAN